ncbi:hypothetical protein J7432_10425 [Xanthomonas axonopodis pv. begoniae]|nr:hypothetical protein [Xanthomonas axonopodis pv. begoniae]MBO9771309.1 hypothetical protein [Xanthomonas axonopodis pv. begoniae]MCC8470584.1 hypothetical protein [Xanthomonas phaseoli]PPT33796.1 hypothetical protein XabCFBP2524_17880 [Xanthomonas axonopodis pv. begoniae]
MKFGLHSQGAGNPLLVLLVGVDARLRAELIEPRQCLLEQWVIAQPRFLLRIKGGSTCAESTSRVT